MARTNTRTTVGRWFRGGAACLLLATASSWALEGQVAQVGLRGLIPSKTPVGLADKDFELLDGKWTDWATQTTELVEKFYSDEALDIPAQRELLAQLKDRVKIMDTALNDGAYRQLHGPLADLHGRLARRVDFASAVLDILEADPAGAQKRSLDDAYGKLKSSIASVQSDLNSIQGGDLWKPYLELEALTNAAGTADNSPSTLEAIQRVTTRLTPTPEWTDAQKQFASRPAIAGLSDAVQAVAKAITAPVDADPKAKVRELAGHFLGGLEEYETNGSTVGANNARVAYNSLKAYAPDGGARLSELMRAHYYNYNLRVVASEGLLRRIMGDNKSEASWINQCVMGARINGQQCTNTNVTVDLRPSSENARISLVVDGTVQANTTGYTSQATVFATGNHYFRAEKDVFFDGKSFSASPASVGANANTHVYGAKTKHSGFPIIGKIADGIALDIAQSKSSEANAYTAQQIRDEVGPRLDSEAQTKFDKANLELETRVWGPLREQGMYPDAMSWSSTDSEALIRTRLMDLDELGGTNPAPTMSVPSEGILIQVHESLLSNFADRFELSGKTMKESELRKMIEERMSKLLGKEVDIEDPVVPEGEKPVDNTLIFDAVDPIRFQAEGGQVKIVMRAGLKPENGEEIPVQIISVPLTFKVEGNQILLERGNVGVKPIAPPENVGLQVTRARIMIQNIQRAIPNKTLKADFTRTVEGKTVNMSIVGIDARDGWVSVQAR